MSGPAAGGRHPGPVAPARACPMCGKEGEERFSGLRDDVCGVAGEWSYRWCDCEVLWLDPRPLPETIPGLYPREYVTHAPPGPVLQPLDRPTAKLRHQIKLEVLRRAWGYSVDGDRPVWAVAAGALLARISRFARWAGYTVRFLPACPSGRLLDVGAGNGAFLTLMSELGWSVQGIEPDPLAAEAARLHGLDVREASIEDAELPDEIYDAITMSHVLEHLHDPVQALARMAGALRPGGVLVSVAPNPVGWPARTFGSHWRELEHPRHLHHFGPHALERLVRSVGLEPIVWTTARSATWIARDSVRLREGRQPRDVERVYTTAKAWWCRLRTLLRPKQDGEETVLVARKP